MRSSPANNGHIAALMPHGEYYTQAEQIVHAPVVSAFNLLYNEYDDSFAGLMTRARGSIHPGRDDHRKEQ